MKIHRYVFAVIAGFCFTTAAQAQGYPNKLIKMIIPFPPGGATDTIGRILADGLSKEFGQPVVVETRTGGGGTVGTNALAKSAPDGYTIGVATVGTHAANPACNPKSGSDPILDFSPISIMARTPNVLTVGPKSPAQDYKQIVEFAKKNPGKLTYATSGTCGIHHLTGEQFRALSGIAITHIPYRGSGPALTDVLGGQVDLFFDSLPGSLSMIQSGKLRAIAVAWEKRLATLPNVPTYAELGLKPINDAVWYGLVAPAKTPEAIIKKLNAAVVKVLAMPEVRERIVATGSEPTSDSPAEFGAEIKSTFEKINAVVKKEGIAPD